MKHPLFLGIISIIMIAVSLHGALAQGTNDTGGLTSGEVNLDVANQMQYTTVDASTTPSSVSNNPLSVGSILSTIEDTIGRQFAQKEQATSQMTDLDIAQENLSHSKQNVATMFGFIVATMIVLFDALFSMIYILLVIVLIWIIFTGWVRFMVLIIDWIYGRIKNGGRI